MNLYGKLVIGNTFIKEAKSEGVNTEKPFHDIMEEAFVLLCRQLEIPVPIWLKKNTREIAQYRKTFFDKEQFIEEVYFDKFVLEIEV